jgi:glycosyltransferase involved in cell wall biosynthesis
MKLSVIIPCYNAKEHIERCLTSLANQNLKVSEYEVILIDDGSKDNTAKIIENLKSTNKNIVFHKQKNQGQGVARNYGLKLAKGEYIYFLDADDYIAHNSLNILLSYLEKYDLDIICFNTIITEKYNLFELNNKALNPEISVTKGIDYISENRHHRLEPWWYITKRTYLLKTGFVFEEGVFLEDAIFTINVIANTKRFAHIPFNAHRYVTSQTSTMRSKNQKHLDKLIKSYVKFILNLNEMISKISFASEVYNPIFVENIRYRLNANVMYMFFKIVNSNYTIKDINRIIYKLKRNNVYPINTKIINEEFSHPKIRLAVYIFNHKHLFYTLLFPLRLLERMNIIRTP